MDDKCTVLINSCDKYEDCWDPFFELLRIHWPDMPEWRIVLNTESKLYQNNYFPVETFQLYKSGKSIPWGRRLIDTLNMISTEYVIILLDDFFLENRVDQGFLEQCIEWMDENQKLACFCFMPTPGPNINDHKYPRFEKRPQDGLYRMNCQAAIWRREKLISYCRPHEDPWTWEEHGSTRSRRYEDELYSLIEGSPLVFDYDVEAGGGIHRGKWTARMPELFRKYGIEVDFSLRGMEELSVKAPQKERGKILTFIRKFRPPLIKRMIIIIKMRINVWRSLR